jgi:Cell wall-associated hydrolases (invasion-associated proteins)
MKTKVSGKKDRYCITIASQSNANKKVSVINTTRGSIITVFVAVVMMVMISIGAAVDTVFQVYRYKAQYQTLTGKIDEQSTLISSYEARLAVLQQADEFQKIADALSAKGTEAGAGAVLAEDSQGQTAQSATENSELAIAVHDAVEQINTDFLSAIDQQITVAKLGTPADAVEVEYGGDMEGDSDTVNNWADVLAVFVVQAGYDITTLQTITEKDCEQLGRIYDDMNQITIGTRTSAVKDESSGAEGEAYLTKLTVNVTINSMDYLEYAEQSGFGNDQKNELNVLMQPDYNMTFAALLGVDLYDGLNSDALSAIIAGLEPGRIGTVIVQAALTRVGDPYSRGRRGSDDYVDCSYFAYWSYRQAGITLPTSSVEQAKYCHYNGYRVELSDLQPGDLIFWQKTGCHCGRWHEIHHAGIYIGNNRVIEASSCKGRVVIRELWGIGGGEWRVYMAGRPYVEESAAAVAAPTVGAEVE